MGRGAVDDGRDRAAILGSLPGHRQDRLQNGEVEMMSAIARRAARAIRHATIPAPAVRTS